MSQNKLMAEVLFNHLEKELKSQTPGVSKISGLFVVSVFKKGTRAQDWYILFQGDSNPPIFSKTRPEVHNDPKKGPIKAVLIEIDDKDLVNLAAGGISGVQGFMNGKVRIAGDFGLAQQLEEVFVQAEGVEKTLDYLKQFKRESKL